MDKYSPKPENMVELSPDKLIPGRCYIVFSSLLEVFYEKALLERAAKDSDDTPNFVYYFTTVDDNKPIRDKLGYGLFEDSNGFFWKVFQQSFDYSGIEIGNLYE